MTMQLGSIPIMQNTPGYFTAPSYGLKGLIIANTSPFILLVFTGLNSKYLYPDTVDWFPISSGFNGNITWYPQTLVSNPTSYTASTISFTAVGVLENVDTSIYPMALTLPAVNPTASGDPIFSATIGFGSTANFQQILNVFNPPNSGALCTFHSARVYTNDTTAGDNAILFMSPGPDVNFNIPVPIQNNSGQTTPTSVCHASAQDTGGAIGFTLANEIEVYNTTPNNTLEFLSFPDNKILLPGNNLAIAMVDGGSGKVTRLTTKWTEKSSLPITVMNPPPPAKPGGSFMPNLTGIYSPLDYGTISGSANDDIAVQKAYNAAASNGGGWVLIHPLLHVFSNSVQLTANNVGFFGMGWASIVKMANAANKYAFVGNNGTNGIINATFYNFKIDGNAANQTGASGCIDGNGFYRMVLDSMWFEAPYEAGVHLHGGPSGGFGFQNIIRGCQFMDGALSASSGMGLWVNNTDENRVEYCFFQAMGGPATIAGQDKVAVLDANGLSGYTNCIFVNCRGGIKCTASAQAGIRIMNCIFDGCPGYPTGGTGNIVLNGSGGNTVIGNRLLNIGFQGSAGSANAYDGIYVAGIDNVIIGNYFNPAGDGFNGCKAMVELDGTAGEDYTRVNLNVFAANVGGSTQITTDGAPTHNDTTLNTLH